MRHLHFSPLSLLPGREWVCWRNFWSFIHFYHYYLPLAMGRLLSAECSERHTIATFHPKRVYQPVDDVCVCALWMKWWCRNNRKVFFMAHYARFVPCFHLSPVSTLAMGLHPNFIHRNSFYIMFFFSLSLCLSFSVFGKSCCAPTFTHIIMMKMIALL